MTKIEAGVLSLVILLLLAACVDGFQAVVSDKERRGGACYVATADQEYQVRCQGSFSSVCVSCLCSFVPLSGGFWTVGNCSEVER